MESTKRVKSISFIHENCDVVEVTAEHIGHINISDISPVIQRVACNSISKSMVANSVAIEIFKEGIAECLDDAFRCGQKETKKDRLTSYDDIVAITVNYEDGDMETYYVDYDDGSGDTQENMNQETYCSSLANLYIVIGKNKTIGNYFDMAGIEDEEYVNYRKGGCGTGGERHSISDGDVIEFYRYVYLYGSGDSCSLAVMIPDTELGCKPIYETKETDRIPFPTAWKYPSPIVEKFLEEKYRGTAFSIQNLMEKYPHPCSEGTDTCAGKNVTKEEAKKVFGMTEDDVLDVLKQCKEDCREGAKEAIITVVDLAEKCAKASSDGLKKLNESKAVTKAKDNLSEALKAASEKVAGKSEACVSSEEGAKKEQMGNFMEKRQEDAKAKNPNNPNNPDIEKKIEAVKEKMEKRKAEGKEACLNLDELTSVLKDIGKLLK